MEENYEKPEKKVTQELKLEIAKLDKILEDERQAHARSLEKQQELIRQLKLNNSELEQKLSSTEESLKQSNEQLQDWERYLDKRDIKNLSQLEALQSKAKRTLERYSNAPEPEALTLKDEELTKRERALEKDLHVKAWRNAFWAILVALVISLLALSLIVYIAPKFFAFWTRQIGWNDYTHLWRAIKSFLQDWHNFVATASV